MQGKRKRARGPNERGQGMTEYIIIVALIAIAAIGVVTIFGENIRAIFGGATDALAGETKVVAPVKKTKKQQTTRRRTLKTFGQQGL